MACEKSRMNDFDPDRIYKQLADAGEEWADKNAAADLLEETKKTVLAEMMQKHRADGITSLTLCESLAQADPAYRLHLTNMVAARKEANRARVRYDSMKVLAEMRRTQESTRRAEINLR